MRPACAFKPPVAALMADGSWLMDIDGEDAAATPSCPLGSGALRAL
ncbi:MAG: hypothetical protein IKZ84_08375 [Victivallales bacterium]|nr:hypothetical protein [Victivallales bacterium]